ncbi:unnamed protein product [Rotaria sp. Silwood1]|nr:unnamed protein product [Rotaria sp. Silwood1]CAF1499862.1 unnamed protein product [Rotaria sp. Silwood1]CAF3645600.1 unnamed protein product [Rotaria sp. Silwood1]CAF4720814.1 unnamed protein product [Rotaria sp. Silwood1]
MKEYIYEVEHSWERQRRPIVTGSQHRQQQHHHRHHRHRCFGKDDTAIDADASSMSETTSESGVSDLETSMTDIRCTCCPYGYHLDTDFMKFLDDMYGSDVLRTLKKIEQKRHDVRHRLINEQKMLLYEDSYTSYSTSLTSPSITSSSFSDDITLFPYKIRSHINLLDDSLPIQTIPITSSSSSTRNSSTFDNNVIRETILELDRIVEKDIKDLENECHRHVSSNQNQSINSGHIHQQRSRSVDSRRHLRPPPRPPTSSSSISSRTAEERRLYEHRMEMEKTITTRTHSAPRLNLFKDETINTLRKIDMTSSGPITMLYKIPPPPLSRSSSSSSLSTETTLRVSSPEPDDHPKEPLKPLYITEIIVPPKPTIRIPEPIKTTVITITDKTEVERRNREIERLELERKTLLNEKELLLKEIDRYKNQTIRKTPEKKTTSITIRTNHEQIHTQQKPLTREVAMQHIVEEDQPPPLPPKQRQQRDVAINHRTEYDEDEEKQIEIVRRKLEEIQNFYTERIYFLEEKIFEQEKDIERLTEPKQQRHVNTQCQPTMQDRALVTDTFRSVRDVALTCHLQPTLPGPVSHRDVNLQCNTDEFIQKRDVWMEALPDVPIKRDVAIGVSINVTPDKHFRDVGTHVNFDYKPEICQRDVAIMFAPEPIEKYDRATNTQHIQTREFGAFANTIEPPKPPSKPLTRQVATDTLNLITQKDTACGSNESTYNRDMSTDTISLISYYDRASGHDIPPELLSRHVSTDTRTLISIRDNFSLTTPLIQPIHIDAQTQSIPIVQHDASSNTFASAEQRHIGVQAVQEQPTIKHQITSTELDIFHQLGYLRHNITNTDIKRSTDRSTLTERQQLRDLAVNTEPKIMYSKEIGDYDVRINDNKYEELISYSLYGQSKTFECGQQTDLYDTKRHVGYIDNELKDDDEDIIEEQRQEIITFRLPLEKRTTEEIYETTIITETKQNNQQIEEIYCKNKLDNFDKKIIKSETTEWRKTSDNNNDIKSSINTQQQQEIRRSKSPEELIEESYEIVSTLTKPHDGNFLIAATSPQSTIVQKYNDLSTSKLQSSEDESSYCEEWTVTEAKRKQDGQTIKTIIDRGGHHRYNVDADSTSASLNQVQQQIGTGTQIHQHEEITQLSPSTIRKTTTFESRRKLDIDEPTITIDTYASSIIPHTNRDITSNEQQLEENYEVTLLSNFDESGLRIFTSKPMTISSNTDDEFELDEELYIACAIVNESLFDINADKKKVNNCLQLIQQEWFRISSQKEVNFRLIEKFLNNIKENFSNFLLERIINLQDVNGHTALHYCVTHGHWHIINMLLDTKVCDVCLQNNAGYTAVMMAAVIDITNDDQRQSVRRLFQESGNLNVKTTDNNQTALMLAVKHGKEDLVELLLESGAAVNLQDSEGSTALMCAVEHGSLNIVKLLLTRPECDVDIVDNNGQTAISIATNKNRKNILVELYAKIKEQKGHHSKREKEKEKPTIRNFLFRSTMNSLNQKTTTTETISPSSRQNSSKEITPTVSTFRRYYSNK